MKGSKILLDGYPRNVSQAETLASLTDYPVGAAIHLDVNRDSLVERLTGRRTCGNCGASYHVVFSPPAKAGICDRCGHDDLQQRPDDTAEKASVRLGVYEKETTPVLDYYESRGMYLRVDGNGSTQDVYSRLSEVISGLENK